MNPDQNQPQEQPETPAPQPTPETVETPSAPEQTVEVPTATPVVEAPATPAVEAPVSNPFEAASGPAVAPVAEAVVPATPAAPVVEAPQPPAKKSNKLIIIVVSAIVGALLLIGGAALALYFLFFSVTKADYQKAYDQVSVIKDSLTEASGAAASADSSSEVTDTIEKAYAEFKTENAKLGSLKALTVDKDVNVKYKAYAAKADKFIAYADKYIPSMVRFLDATTEISRVTSSKTASSSSVIQDTIDILKGLKNVEDPAIKAYVDSSIEAYEEILVQMKIYESTTTSNTQKYNAITAVSASTKKLSQASTTLSADLKEKTDDYSLKTETLELLDAIDQKLKAAK